MSKQFVLCDVWFASSFSFGERENEFSSFFKLDFFFLVFVSQCQKITAPVLYLCLVSFGEKIENPKNEKGTKNFLFSFSRLSGVRARAHRGTAK